MAKKYLVVHPKLGLRASVNGGKSKLQNVPVGTEIEMEEKHAKSLLASGKLKLAVGKKEAKSTPKSK